MADEKDPNLPDIDLGLDALTETTTAGQLLRSKGQKAKLKTVNKDKLKQWIAQAIDSVRASVADEFDDREKEEMLRQAETKLKELMARANKAEQAVREREARDETMQNEIEALRNQASEGTVNSEELDKAMAAIDGLTTQRNEAQEEADELRADLYQVQDQLNEKMTLLQTTIDEKDRLKATMQELMIKSGDLTGSVLQIDNDYYATKHQDENPQDDGGDPNQAFFHDFAVGATIIQSLQEDLEKLREITKREEDSGSHAHLLAQDLALLEQLKDGDIRASDVAAPIDGLVEALEGARTEADELAGAVSDATGMPMMSQSRSDIPENEGDPAQVVAASTQVLRELGASFAQAKGQIRAMKALADDADSERNDAEAEADKLKAAYRSMLTFIGNKSAASGLETDAALLPDNIDSGDPIAQAAAANSAVKALSELAESASVEPEIDPEEIANLKKAQARLLDAVKRQAEASGLVVPAVLSDVSEESIDESNSEKVAAAETLVEQFASAAAAKESATAAKETEAALAEIQKVLAESAPVAAMAAAAAVPVVTTEEPRAEELAESAAEPADDGLDLSDAFDDDDEEEDVGAASMALPALEPVPKQDSIEESAAAASALEEPVFEEFAEVEAEESAAAMAAPSEESSLTEAAEAQNNQADAVLAASALQGQLLEKVQALAGEVQSARTREAETTAQLAEREEEAQRLSAEKAELERTNEEIQTKLNAIEEELAKAKEEQEVVQSQAAAAAEQESQELEELRAKEQSLSSELEVAQAEAKSLQEQLSQIESDQNEVAESSKEIIAQLTAQRDARDEENNALKEQVAQAEAMNQDYLNTLGELNDLARTEAASAQGNDEELAAAAAQLDQRLGAVPDKETDIPVKTEDIAALAEAGVAMRAALRSHYQQKAEETSELAESTREVVGELTKQKDKLHEEVESLRKELVEAKAGEEKVQALAQSALELAGTVDAPELKEISDDLEINLSQGEEGDVQLAEEKSQEDVLAQTQQLLNGMQDKVKALQAEKENKEAELARIQEEKESELASLAEKESELESLREAGEAAKAREAEMQDVQNKLEADIAAQKELLRDAKGAIAEYRTRAESADGSKDAQINELREQVRALEADTDRRNTQAQDEMEEQKVERNVLEKRLDEMRGKIEDRDAEILSLQERLDGMGSERIDKTEYDAKLTALEEELAESKERLAKFEGMRGQTAGEEGRLQALEEEMQRHKEERSQVQSRIRGLEDEIATEHGKVEALQASRDEQRQSHEAERNQLAEKIKTLEDQAQDYRNKVSDLESRLAGVQARNDFSDDDEEEAKPEV